MRDVLIESIIEIQSAHADLDENVMDALTLWNILIASPAAIVILCMGSQALTSTEIKRRRYYVGTNFSYNLASLKRMGLMEAIDHVDGRKRLLRLTAEGHALAGRLRRYLDKRVPAIGLSSERNAA